MTTEAQRHRGCTEKSLMDFSVHPLCLCASVLQTFNIFAPREDVGVPGFAPSPPALRGRGQGEGDSAHAWTNPPSPRPLAPQTQGTGSKRVFALGCGYAVLELIFGL